MEFREGYTLEKWPQISIGSLIYEYIYMSYLLIGTFIIPMGIISCFYCCVVNKVLANSRKLQTTVNDKQILKERERSNKRVMVNLLAIAGAFFVLVFPNRIIWVILDITGARNIGNTTYRIVKYAARFPYFFHVSINPFIYSFIDKKFQQDALGFFKVKGKGSYKKSISSIQSWKHMSMGTARRIVNCNFVNVTERYYPSYLEDTLAKLFRTYIGQATFQILVFYRMSLIHKNNIFKNE